MSMVEPEVVRCLGFYRWLASEEGERASLEERLRQAHNYIKHVLMPQWDAGHPGRQTSPERRRYYHATLRCYNHCLRNNVPLPPEPLYIKRRTAVPAVPASAEGL